jgi:predicted dehydrogenase
MKKWRIGIAGVGRFGRLHLSVLRRMPDCSVAAIADTDAALLRKVARANRIRAAHGDALDLVRRPDLDAVDIVTDEASHGRLVVEALRRGKHVFVEKPLATTRRQAETIAALAGRTGLHVMVGNISRFSQPYVTLRRRVRAGELGRIGIIRAKRDFSRSWFSFFGKRIHTVYESGIHDIDLILWFARGRCARVHAVEERLGGHRYPDVFTATLTFDDGLIATLTSAWLVPRCGPRNLVETLELDGTIDADLEILGTRGGARFRMLDSGLSVWTDRAALRPELTLWPTGHDGAGGAIRAELRHFVELLGRKGPSAVAPLADSVYALAIADAIVQSARTGKVVVMKGGRP